VFILQVLLELLSVFFFLLSRGLAKELATKRMTIGLGPLKCFILINVYLKESFFTFSIEMSFLQELAISHNFKLTLLPVIFMRPKTKVILGFFYKSQSIIHNVSYNNYLTKYWNIILQEMMEARVDFSYGTKN